MADSSSIDLYFLLFGGTVTMLLLAVGLVTFLLQYQKKVIRQDLAFKEAEVKHNQELFLGTLEATETERARLARDLHDVVGASLSALRLQVSEIGKGSKSEAEILKRIDLNKQMIDDMIMEVRRISNDLLPPGLEEFGLAYSVEGLCENVLVFSNLEIILDVHETEKLNKQKSLIIFRILQELLNNTVKHSGASKVVIDLKVENSELKFSYSDNGKGFDFEEAYKKRSLGLKNIEVRTKMVKGTATFETKANKGLSVEIRIPV